MVKYFVAHGAEVNYKGVQDQFALHYAASNDSLDMVDYLVNHGADVNCENDENRRPLHYRCDSPLHLAARHGSLELVEYLVDHGANVNYKNEWNETPLHHAVESDEYDSLTIVDYLVRNGADVNSRKEGNTTALHIAARNGFLTKVECLVNNGAKVNIEELSGEETVLFWALNSKSEKIVDYLLQHGAIKDINHKDSSGRSFLNIVCCEGNAALVQTLLKYNVDLREEEIINCRNQEIFNIIKIEVNKSKKHQEKINILKGLTRKQLIKVK